MATEKDRVDAAVRYWTELLEPADALMGQSSARTFMAVVQEVKGAMRVCGPAARAMLRAFLDEMNRRKA